MAEKEKIKVLVVDDSLVFREIIVRGISGDSGIEVVATATDPFDARDKILEYRPDVMTCDIEMPKMNGIEFIRRLLPQYSLPVIVVSTISGAVFDALNVGAVEFLSKPDMTSQQNVSNFISDLIVKIKIASRAKVKNMQPENPKKETPVNPGFHKQIIAIGASTGGTEAISYLLKNLHAKLPGIVIVQHIPPIFSNLFAERLNLQTSFSVKEAADGDSLAPGQVLVAPGNQHIRLKKVHGSYQVEVFSAERVNGHRPSVDIFFESVAEAAGKNSTGIILTGMGYDGAKGLLSMRKMGARTIGQDEKSCVVYGMPKVANDIGAVEMQLPLTKIPETLLSIISG